MENSETRKYDEIKELKERQTQTRIRRASWRSEGCNVSLETFPRA